MTTPKGSLPESQYELLCELDIKKNRTPAEQKKWETMKAKLLASDSLSDSCKSFLTRTYAIEKYYSGKKGRQRSSMVKGSIVQQEAFNLFMESEGKKYNTQSKLLKNDFISGIPDMYDGTLATSSEEIIEIKSSWNIFSFLSAVNKPLKSSYYWQLMGYMYLTGAKIGTIAFCLINTPENILEDEKQRVLSNRKLYEEDEDKFNAMVEELSIRMNYNDIPVEDRVLRFTVERNDSDITKISKKVEKCREYLQEFEIKHKFFTKNYRREKLLSLKNGK